MGWVLLALIVWLSGEVDDEINWMVQAVAKGAAKLIIYIIGFIAFMYVIA